VNVDGEGTEIQREAKDVNEEGDAASEQHSKETLTVKRDAASRHVAARSSDAHCTVAQSTAFHSDAHDTVAAYRRTEVHRPVVTPTGDLIPCEHCHRSFSETAYRSHVAWCIQSGRPSLTPYQTSQADFMLGFGKGQRLRDEAPAGRTDGVPGTAPVSAAVQRPAQRRVRSTMTLQDVRRDQAASRRPP
jgi:hypothetical protein